MMRARAYIETDVAPNQRFECKSLFHSYEWERLSNGEKRGFGIYFANEVKEGRVPGVIKTQEAKNKHNLYCKEA